MTGQLSVFRAAQNYLARFGTLFGHDDRNAGLEDSRLFAGDFLQRMAEKIFVVEIDAA